jgi:hypothetical protein
MKEVAGAIVYSGWLLKAEKEEVGTRTAAMTMMKDMLVLHRMGD